MGEAALSSAARLTLLAAACWGVQDLFRAQPHLVLADFVYHERVRRNRMTLRR
jgi:hypothetical protein